MRTSYSLLHPSALALSGSVGALVLALLCVGTMGAGSMMGGAWTMGGYGPYGGYPGYHMTVGGGFFMLVRSSTSAAVKSIAVSPR